jgi:ABC-2 type transport system permease protein
MEKNTLKRQNLIELIILLMIIVVANVMGTYWFTRWDMTDEHRYTLNETTKDILSNLDDVVFVKIYLDGEMPAGFQRLRKALHDMLDEFRIYGGDNVQYKFVNLNSYDEKRRKDIYNQLYKQGLDPITVYEKSSAGVKSEKILFPGAIMSFKNKDFPINFLEQALNKTPDENLNASVQDLEYKLINALYKLRLEKKKSIAVIQGHRELEVDYLRDILESLSNDYKITLLTINHQLKALKDYEAIIIPAPRSKIDKFDKFIIDQYIMKGGKVLWLVDGTNADLDSLADKNMFLAMDMVGHINLSRMLFQYGVRINPDLIQDLQCSAIPINTSIAGTDPKFDLFPWVYEPLMIPSNKSVITKNINLVQGNFTSSIDTVGDDGLVKKTILLTTSKYTRLLNVPVQVSISAALNKRPDANMFLLSYVPTAVLLEGSFKSLYAHRIPPEIEQNKEIAFQEKSVRPTKMIVVADGDVIKNQIHHVKGQVVPYPLGYDKYTGQSYGNKDFILNAVNYLMDDVGLLSVRAKDIKLRLLDKTIVAKNRSLIQWINLLSPIILLLLLGIFYMFITRKKYKVRN